MILHLLLFQLLLLFPICIFFIFIPYWTRKTDSFGVTIPEEMYNHHFIRSIRKQYALYMTGVSIVIILSMIVVQQIFAMNEDAMEYTSIICMLIIGIVGFICYLLFHFKMKHFKNESVEMIEDKQIVVVQTSFHTEKRTYSNVWFVLPGALLMFTVIFTLKNYELFPNEIPTNYNLYGEATSWVEKSRMSVLFIPIIQLYMIVIFMGTNTIIRTAKQQINAAHPDRSMQQNIRFRRRWSAFIIGMGILTIALFSFVQFTHVYPIPTTIQLIVFIGYTAVILIGIILLTIKTGQGGSRIQMTNENTEKGIQHVGDDDKHWKLGIFYVNKEDPSLFLEKRFGIGWSINLARPLVWVILGLLFGSIFLITLIF